VCGVPLSGAASLPITLPPGGSGNSCNPSFSFYEIGSRTQWNPAPQLDVGFELLYSHLNSAYKGPGVYSANTSRPAVALIDDQRLVRDVPLAAQLLSVMALLGLGSHRTPAETSQGFGFLI
jgi:hypothetical protein